MMHAFVGPSRREAGSGDAVAEPAPRRVCRAARGAPRATGWSSGQRQRLARASRAGPDGDQGERGRLRRPDAASVVVCDLFGASSKASSASSDAATHGYVYRDMPEVGGVAHTHSPYATAFAARGDRFLAC